MSKTGYDAISDILDAVTDGELFDSGYLGHGYGYYNGNSDAAYKETLANISDLYNCGNTDLLYNYLPKEVCDQLIYSYEDMIGLEAISLRINFYSEYLRREYGENNYFDSVIDYLNGGDSGVL